LHKEYTEHNLLNSKNQTHCKNIVDRNNNLAINIVTRVTIRFVTSALQYKWSIVTMRLSCMETWHLKYDGVTTLTFWGHVTSSLLARLTWKTVAYRYILEACGRNKNCWRAFKEYQHWWP